MVKLLSIACALIAVSMGAATGDALPPVTAQAICAGPEFRGLDFWVGSWDLSWAGGTGTNTITRELGDCVIHEHFSGDASQQFLRGESVSMYQPKLGLWRQTWVDNQDGYIPLTGGPQKDGTFLLTTTPLDGKPAQSRMIFEDIKPASFTWRWQFAKDGKTWADNWVIHYTRKK